MKLLYYPACKSVYIDEAKECLRCDGYVLWPVELTEDESEDDRSMRRIREHEGESR